MRERIAGCRRDNNNRRSRITNYKRQAECVSIFYFLRGSRKCVRAQEGLGDSRSLDFILNVMTLPQALKRHSDRARIPSYCYERRRVERKNERERERECSRRNFSSRVAPRMETRRGAESRRTSY